MSPVGLNTVFVGVLGAAGKRLDPHLAVNFLVEIDGLVVGGFQQVEGLESTIDTEDYVEGGRNDYVHTLLKGAVPSRLILSSGLTEVDSLWAWHERTRRGVIQRKNGTVMLLDREHLPVMWWNFVGALPVKWVGPALDASNATQVAIERVELAHRGIYKPVASQAAAAARLGGSLT